MSEKKPRRYNFTSYIFGNDGDVNLVIETATGDFGYLTQYALELTVDERRELINVLLTAKKVGEN